MLTRRLLSTAVALLANGLFNTCYANANGSSSSDPLVDNLIDWLRANGAYINEKLVVKNVVPDDPSSPRGVFATQDMDDGETLCSIPSKLIVKSRDELMKGIRPEMSYCGTIKAVMEAMSGNDITPYGQYLLAQPKGYLPRFWSKDGSELMAKMLKSTRTQQLTEYDELPPHGVEDEMSELEEECNGDISDPFYIQAAMLVQARADYDAMIPFYDMFNHHNGKYNMKHTFDPYKDPMMESAGSGFVTTKHIKAGEELYNSYNHCNICYEYIDWQGTPEMFLSFGFVESYPQRWLFDFARVKFDLDWKDGDETTGDAAVNFLVPPSKKGMGLLQSELGRLKSFAKIHRSKSVDDYNDISKYEWGSLWQYYDALHDAISYAVKSDAALSEDVWKLDDNWWVQDGTTKGSDVHEHPILPTKSDEAANDEL